MEEVIKSSEDGNFLNNCSQETPDMKLLKDCPYLPSVTAVKADGRFNEVITVEEAVEYLKSLNLTKDCFRLPVEKTRLNSLLTWLRNSPKLEQNLSTEVDFVYSLTQCSLNWDDPVHVRILQTIYKKLTCSPLDCPKKGAHWQSVGFQGTDPSTDLRAVGLFGLVQFLSLTSDCILPLGRKLHAVANSEEQPFPLAVLSLNVTNIVLNVFNTGKLNRECNAQKSVIPVMNSFYAALLVYILNAWVSQKKTIKDSGYLLKDAERYCGRNVRRVLKDLSNNLKRFDPI